MAEPLVSIGVPCHNAADYIDDALRSAFAQTHGNLEVIVYDDHSSDESLQRVRAIGDPRLQLIAAPHNRGVAAARQAIKEKARGDYLAWLDADDRFDPDRIALLLAEAVASCADLVTDNARLIDARSERLPGLRRVPDAVAADPHFTRIFERNAMLPHPLVSRRCFTALDYDVGLKTSEDYDYWLRCSLAGYRFRRVDRVLMDYRISEGSLSADPAASRAALQQILAKHDIAELEALYRARGYPDEIVDYMACLQHLFRGQYPLALERARRPWLDEPGADRDFYLGTLAQLCGEDVMAERHLRSHLARTPDSPAGLNNLGVLLAGRGGDPGTFWQRAIELFPRYADVRENLAGGCAITRTLLTTDRPR